MFHTSPVKIEKINKFGIAGDCLFFSDDIYRMSECSIYVYEADFDCVEVSQLYDEEVIQRIADYFECDTDAAEDLLCGVANEFDCGADGDDSWWLQGMRGQCAKKMGYDGCKDRDEQGTVYIVPMFGRENDLSLNVEL